MNRSAFLPLVAIASFAMASWHMAVSQQQPPRAQPTSQPPVAEPELNELEIVAGAGVVEARTDNIKLGSQLAGVAAVVDVKVGDRVRANQKLFSLDDRQARADLAVKEAKYRAAESQLTKLAAQPRSEELPASTARIVEAEATLADRLDLVRRTRELFARRASGQEELVRAEQAYRVAVAQRDRAAADDRLLRAGAWEEDKNVVKAAMAEARAAVDQARVEIDRHTVSAPLIRDDGRPLDLVVMQINVRPGEYVGGGSALMVLGSVDRLHVRIDVDENDIPRFRTGAPGRIVVRGGGGKEFRIKFARVEPFVVPKRSLTGDSSERVDTRVLQVLYEIENQDGSLFVGQQVDAFFGSSGVLKPNDGSDRTDDFRGEPSARK